MQRVYMYGVVYSVCMVCVLCVSVFWDERRETG